MLVGEFVVVANLFEYWSLPTTVVHHCSLNIQTVYYLMLSCIKKEYIDCFGHLGTTLKRCHSTDSGQPIWAFVEKLLIPAKHSRYTVQWIPY